MKPASIIKIIKMIFGLIENKLPAACIFRTFLLLPTYEVRLSNNRAIAVTELYWNCKGNQIEQRICWHLTLGSTPPINDSMYY